MRIALWEELAALRKKAYLFCVIWTSYSESELLILNASHRPRPPIEAFQVSSERITPVSSARNIGVVFDQEMTLAEHVTTICKTCFLHLMNIAKIRDSLSQKDTEILVHAFIYSKLDICISLLYIWPSSISDWSSTSCPELCCTPRNSFQETWSYHANSETITLASRVQPYQIQDASVNL